MLANSTQTALKRAFFIVAMGALLSGCAASRALDEPAHKNLDVLKPGTNRDLVRAELGQPLPSVSGSECDVYSFPEGSSGWKYMRAMGYSLLDIGTLGLSEVVTNPVEASVGKDKVQLRVCFGEKQSVIYSERLQVGAAPQIVTGAYPPAPLAPVTATELAPVSAPATNASSGSAAAAADDAKTGTPAPPQTSPGGSSPAAPSATAPAQTPTTP